jgi:hypothetical protein
MRQVHLTKRPGRRVVRYDPLPLDPRDPAVVRAKGLARRAGETRRQPRETEAVAA